MLESLIINYDEILFILLSCGVILFSVLAIMSNHQRSAISNFLVTTILVSGLVVLSGKTYIGIGMAILYTSLCSVFLLASRVIGDRKVHIKYPVVFYPVLAGILLFLLSLYKLSDHSAITTRATEYAEIYVTILLVYLLCIIIASGISFCYRFCYRLKHAQK